MDTNITVLTGRSTRDVELRTTGGGTSVATISLAVNNNDDVTSFFDITCFGKTADNVSKYVAKGRQVVVTGRLQQRKWQDKKTGENRYAVEVIANQVQFVGGRDTAQESQQDVVLDDIDDKPISLDDLPF